MDVQLIEGNGYTVLFHGFIENIAQIVVKIPIFVGCAPCAYGEIDRTVAVLIEHDGRLRSGDGIFVIFDAFQKKCLDFIDVCGVGDGDFDHDAPKRHVAVIDELGTEHLAVGNDDGLIAVSEDLGVKQTDVLHKPVQAADCNIISLFEGFCKDDDDAVCEACEAVFESEGDGEGNGRECRDDARRRKSERADDHDGECDVEKHRDERYDERGGGFIEFVAFECRRPCDDLYDADDDQSEHEKGDRPHDGESRVLNEVFADQFECFPNLFHSRLL